MITSISREQLSMIQEQSILDRLRMEREMAEDCSTITMAATIQDIGMIIKCMEKVVFTTPTAHQLTMATGTWITFMAKAKSITTLADEPHSPSTTKYSPINIYNSVGRSTKVTSFINKNMEKAS